MQRRRQYQRGPLHRMIRSVHVPSRTRTHIPNMTSLTKGYISPHPPSPTPSSSMKVTNLPCITPRLARDRSLSSHSWSLDARSSSYTLTSRRPVPPSLPSSPKIPSTSSPRVTRPGSHCTLVDVSLQIPQDGLGGQRLTVPPHATEKHSESSTAFSRLWELTNRRTRS